MPVRFQGFGGALRNENFLTTNLHHVAVRMPLVNESEEEEGRRRMRTKEVDEEGMKKMK